MGTIGTSHKRVETDVEKRAHLCKVMKDFHTAMLVTRASDGGLRSRPLAIAETRDDGGIYFATAIDSPKVHELEADTRVNVSMQSNMRYVSITGRARVVRDRALIDQLWTEAWRTWFPDGKDDPSLCLIAVDPEEAEYWDHTGVKILRYMFEQAKAFVTHARPSTDDDAQNAKVHLQR